MRDFNDADRKKKSERIQLPDNPGNLSEEALTRLRAAVSAAAKDGAVRCPAAWKLALDSGVSRLDVGAAIDRLGIRVTHCQLGCFQVEKASHDGQTAGPVDAEATRQVEALAEKGELTCSNVFSLAQELHASPGGVADAANRLGRKLKSCQLGCF